MYVDCTIFSGEIDMLNLRLHELQTCVSHHVIVESAYSFSNQYKGLSLPQYLPKLQQFAHKIIYLPILIYPTNLPDDKWACENYTRNYPLKYMKDNFPTSTPILVSDLDEIPNPIVLLQHTLLNPILLELDFYYYNLNWQKQPKWYRAYLARLGDIVDLDQQRLTLTQFFLRNAGWHLSYFLPIDKIAQKIQHFSHTEYNHPQFTNLEHIQKAINQGLDLFDRNDTIDQLIPSSPNALLPTYAHLLPPEFR